MKPATIQVNDNPNTGVCDVVDHFKEALENDAVFNGVAVQYDEKAEEDNVLILDKDGMILARFDDAMALRVDLVSQDLQKLKGGHTHWEAFVKKYGV